MCTPPRGGWYHGRTVFLRRRKPFTPMHDVRAYVLVHVHVKACECLHVPCAFDLSQKTRKKGDSENFMTTFLLRCPLKELFP